MPQLRDTLDFLLYQWLDAAALTARPRHAEHSRETFDAVLELAERLARERFAPFNRLVDTEEPRFDGERVHLPEATSEAVAAYLDAGLLASGHDYEHRGMQLPYVVELAANAFFFQASIGLSAYAMLTCANANLLMALGSQAQQRAFALPELQGRFLGTMCLSEPQAGSSLGDITTRAEPDGPGSEGDPLGARYRLRGNKMWISGGDHELRENIVHLVLAKIPDADGRLVPGVKGISLFVVPRVLVDSEGRLTGERNDVALAGLNHKLGYRATVNTLLNFGEGRYPVRGSAGAIGYLVGAPGRGLEAMFHMMNEARINVGMGAAMLGWAGYVASVDYARTRAQGRRAGGPKDAAARPVAIVEHPDVRRMLLAQRAYSEGGLALILYCARLVDEKRHASPEEAADLALLLELLTPIAKSWPSEWCLEANSLAIQVHGGYGYTRDFPVEQLWRDNRLNLIHEGTHGIQALDLLGRKVPAAGGRGLRLLLARMQQTVARAEAHSETAVLGAALARQLLALESTTTELSDVDTEVTLANATPYLQAFGHLTLAWLWLDLTCATTGADAGASGRLQTARFFYAHELPKVEAWLAPLRQRDASALDMHPDWF